MASSSSALRRKSVKSSESIELHWCVFLDSKKRSEKIVGGLRFRDGTLKARLDHLEGAQDSSRAGLQPMALSTLEVPRQISRDSSLSALVGLHQTEGC